MLTRTGKYALALVAAFILVLLFYITRVPAGVGEVVRNATVLPPLAEQWPPLLFNPLDPLRVQYHPPILADFQPTHPYPFSPTHLTDFLGVETRYSWDCIDDPASTMHYFIVSPSRRYPCETHAARVAAGYTDPNPGDVPVVDDEYEEWLDVLQSVARTQDAYVMMELGARYGTWGVRALKAWERLRGTPARFIGVEADATFFTWMEEHVEHNNLTQYSTLLHQMAAKGKGTDLLSLVEKAQLDHIDYLDADIQLAEGDFFDHPATLTWMDQHVGAVHIGTHSDAVHARLKKRFESRGWTLLFAYAPGYHRGGHNCDNHLEKALQQQPDCMVESPYGKIYVRDGMLSFANGNRLGEPA